MIQKKKKKTDNLYEKKNIYIYSINILHNL